ncbi:carbohydrate kinase [Macrolepiota fuliginosa MF-IS2]|uniref:Gluconokinase n=1 Tax=Macrolepiota fuliginosa MF-IS2 TaxID=1400762 RepID=A0A9P6C059_9AGAR|nr:carbohydrate kinase [Macrolepiota fuliginosa MF-IS2]
MPAIPINDQPQSGVDISQAAREVFIVVMGVSGTGKSTLGTALAEKLGMPYVEGDDLHPKSNVDKMSSGVPLTDADREPWLRTIRLTAESRIAEIRALDSGVRKRGVVITCSALKRYYRDILRGKVRFGSSSKQPPYGTSNGVESDLSTYFVWINGSKELLEERIGKRQGHFFKASMLESQMRTLESPEGEEGVVVVPLEVDTDEQVRIAVEGLNLPQQ